MDSQDSEHKKFAGTIKGLHSHLRTQFRQAKGDFKSVWDEHCQNEELLSQYADAMRRLATDIWTKKRETRIDWCRSVCLEYFLNGGLEKLRQKDKRKLAFEMLRKAEMRTLDASDDSTNLLEPTQETTLSEQLGNGQCLPVHLLGREGGFSQDSTLPTVEVSRIDVDSRPLLSNRVPLDAQVSNSILDASSSNLRSEVTPKKIDSQCICLPFAEKISILDVGSCYNPFKEFEEFLAVGLDLCPAVEGVHRCDFLQLEVVQQPETNSPRVDFTTSLPSVVTSLPGESFHVVVFSLLLEYLPSPRQRWTCCRKAHGLLMLDGLLVIVSPDSHHQLRNAPMMRSWKMAIESLGFSRWRYVKQEHLHCIAFRKTRRSADGGSSELGEDAETMLYIPQDLHEDEERRKTDAEQDLNSVSENDVYFMDDLNEIVLDD